jgi:hypothetical protein
MDNEVMDTTAAQTVLRYKRISCEYRSQIKNNPEFAKETLIKAGILIRSDSSPSGVTLAKYYRSKK